MLWFYKRKGKEASHAQGACYSWAVALTMKEDRAGKGERHWPTPLECLLRRSIYDACEFWGSLTGVFAMRQIGLLSCWFSYICLVFAPCDGRLFIYELKVYLCRKIIINNVNYVLIS